MMKISLRAWGRLGVGITVVSAALLGCATMSTAPLSNPWQTINRAYDPGSEEDTANLNSLMQPCVDHARETFVQAVERAKMAPTGAEFAVVARNDQGWNFFVDVTQVDGLQVVGRVTRDTRVKGRDYTKGDSYTLATSEIVDWLIIYQDRPEEGNWTGKYVLLRQDGLVSGPCDPNDSEFQHFRFFERGYSFVPPNPAGWDVKGKEVVPGLGLIDFSMQEDGGGPDELNTLYAARYEAPVFETNEEFVEKATEVEKKNVGDPKRYTLLEHEVAEYAEHKAKCVRSHQVIEDKRALLSKSGERGPMIREILSLSCVHPRVATMVVGITYSHRYRPGYRDSSFNEKADAVFRSVAFRMDD